MMKKITLIVLSGILLLAAVAATAQTTNPAPYCSAAYDDGHFAISRYISKVTFDTFTNNSGTTQAPGGHYIFYNNLNVPTYLKDSTYDLSLSFSSGSYHYLIAYIDYNHDSDFNDAGERVFVDSNNTAYANPRIGTVTIPLTAKSGRTRMRVMIFEDDIYTMITRGGPTPCTADTLDWGETEDYIINIAGGTSTGIAGMQADKSVAVYPNPASGQIRFAERFAGARMLITDMQGRTVASENAVTGTYNVGSLPAGIYMVRLTNTGESYTQKLEIVK